MQVVLEHLPFVSEQILACAFETRRVLVDGEPVEPSHSLSLGQTWEMIFHRHETEVLDTRVEILHVDEDLVVVNKPPSIPVHPIGRFRKNSVDMILREEHPELLADGKCLKLVHRLDRLVSGVLVIARTTEKAALFHKHLQQDFIEKEYVARVKGKFPEGRLEVREPIAKVQDDPPLYSVDRGGKACHTVFERESVSVKCDQSLVRCRPVTGRPHQIRVHLQWLGHPIVNDYKYGGTLLENSPRVLPPEPTDYQREAWCTECQQGGRDIGSVSQEELTATSIWLHAVKYSNTHPFYEWTFQSPRPPWATSF
ncbi:RNA pseudouridine synthase 7 [Geodia barretti]|uniref:Pseudouridine synthase n=1 Tax=Geodia barretti TaxID=519541 RepID=A0AA35STS6_GEOBA|nr:RNA pseudouridine synthase 7 [Geodia barretti]